MKVIQLSTGEKMVVISTKNKQIFRINLNMKNNNLIRIDSNSKSQHEKEVNYIEFNPNNNILITLSKSSIILYDINNPSTNFRKISNFALIGKEYINGIIPNISYCFNNYSYFIHGKKCSKIYLLDLKLNEQNKIDNKNFIKNSIFMLDLDKEIFRKVNDKEIKIFQISILQHLYEYLIIGSNKGLIIFKFDSDNKAPLITLSNMPWLDKTKIQNYFFYNYTKENIILEEKIMISYDKKNKILINKSQRKIEDNILDNSKSLINNYELKINFRNNLIACIDKISNIYIIYKIKPDLKNSNPYCISELIKIDSGEALSFEWCIYSNNFAITKQVSNSTSFLLQVYSINDKDKINKIYEIKDLLSHKIFGGHFIGVIVKKHGEYLQVQMKYINSYNYDIIKDAELNFYYWDEENKLNLSIKEEPLNIISSEDLQFMIICFKDKYNIYQLNELTGNLEKINTVYDKVIHGIIYENIIFLYLTEFGTYFQILNKQCTFPFKLFRQSDEVNLYNLKISKKFKENKLFYNKKPKQTKILCINDNLIFTTDYSGNIEISELNHILFKIISLIKKKI
jgi:WD40 repeat protein